MFLKNSIKILLLILALWIQSSCNQDIIERFSLPSQFDQPDEEDLGGEDPVGQKKQDIPSPPDEVIPSLEETDIEELGIEYGNSGKKSKSQKGPFYMDSDIFIQEIEIENNDLILSGKIFIDRVIDDQGSFILPKKITSPYLDIRVNGYYFNEITGLPSDGTISLGSYSSLKDGKNPNINILTTLSQKRIKYLLQNYKLNFEEAETLSKKEVLRIFKINDAIKNFDELSIDGSSDGDAALLAISLILQGNLNTVELSNFIAKIREDLKDNGIINDESIKEQICQQTRSLDPISIRENLRGYYDSIGLEEYHIPFFEDYLDSDCNGLINKYDPESFIFFNIKMDSAVFDDEVGYSIYPFQDKLWVMGADLDQMKFSSNFLDWENFESGDFNNLHSPIMFSYDGNLNLVGGRERVVLPDQTVLNNIVGHYSLTSDLSFSEIKNRYFQDYSDDLEYNDTLYQVFLRFSILNRVFFNFSKKSHKVIHYQNKIYLMKKGLDFNAHQYSRVLNQNLEWESDELTNLLDPWAGYILDIISFNDQFYILAPEMTPSRSLNFVNHDFDEVDIQALIDIYNNPPEVVEGQIVSAAWVAGDEDFSIRIKLMKYDPQSEIDYFTEEKIFINSTHFTQEREQHFTLYEDLLIITNSDCSIISYSRDGENWHEVRHPYWKENTDYYDGYDNYIYHEPIVYKNMIHLIGGSSNFNPEYNGVVYGFYRYYKQYIEAMNLN